MRLEDDWNAKGGGVGKEVGAVVDQLEELVGAVV
jgi:hypothetical protein